MSRSCGLLMAVACAGLLAAQPKAISPDPNARRPIERSIRCSSRR
ncbi:MAG TPA: hypothetical protein VKA46_24245 [Gemmataceae bacterium]|nr:hypothetical protein [Gemmataceae bacterium]